jgi:hypothetical protein
MINKILASEFDRIVIRDRIHHLIEKVTPGHQARGFHSSHAHRLLPQIAGGT